MNRQHILPQLMLRSWPFPRGAGRLTDKLFRQLPFKNDIETVRTTDGFDISVMPNDLIGRHLYLTGEFDRSTVEILTAFAEPGDALLDIGANIGYVSACFLQNVPQSTVLAVEPQPGILDLLQRNLDQFGSRKAVYPFAISVRDGEALFQIDEENRGASGIGASGVKINIRSGSSLFADNKINTLDLVKIDVEGHEEEVISSCLPHFARLQPKIIMFEEHGDKSSGAIGEMLKSAGYSIFGIKKHLTKLSLQPVRSSEDCVHNDYVAISLKRKIPDNAARRYNLTRQGASYS